MLPVAIAWPSSCCLGQCGMLDRKITGLRKTLIVDRGGSWQSDHGQVQMQLTKYLSGNTLLLNQHLVVRDLQQGLPALAVCTARSSKN